MEAGARALTLKDATFWVAVTSAAIVALSVLVTIVYGEIQRRGQARQQRQSEEQLRLAREQAELQPKLEVYDMQLITLRDAGVPDEYIVSYQQASVQREQAIEQGITPTSPPPPNGVLRFKISNRGRVAATQVAGKLFLRSAHLRVPANILPSAQFSYGISDETKDGCFVVCTQRLPEPLLNGGEPVTFDIAVGVRDTAKTSIGYEFVSAEGGIPAKGEVPLVLIRKPW